METGQTRRVLLPLTATGALSSAQADGRLACSACAHRCSLRDGQVGACGVRWRSNRELRVPFGYVAASHVRPVETNTVYHVVPGRPALTFGMYGCDMRCPYCHNWRLSQAPRDNVRDLSPRATTPEQLIDTATAADCAAVCAAYNEPIIAAEWVKAIFGEAQRRGLITALISDGHTTREALEYLRPVTDVCRIDLKAFTEEQYATLGGRLSVVLDAIEVAQTLGYWVEVVTLVVPDFNDDPRGLRWIARHLASVDVDMPWHLNAFYPRYRWRGRPSQGAGLLVTAAGTAYALGLRHVYVGNLADQVRELSHTRCPRCQTVVVERRDYRALSVNVVDGHCPTCATPIAGQWLQRTVPARSLTA
jgi:pyruvate formate lyase activating enzyme